MKKYLFIIILSLLINSNAFARSTGCKEGNCENGYGNGFIQIKLLTKENGLEQRKMVKELKLGLTDIFTKENLRIVNGAD